MITRMIFFVSVFLLMLVAGVFWGTWFTLTRSLEEFTSQEFIHIGRVIIDNVAVPMRIILPSSILFTLLAILIYPGKRSLGFYFAVSALGLLTATLLITLLVLVPIDNQIKSWTEVNIPPDWTSLRNTWQDFHAARTLTSLSSFGCLVYSVLSIK